MFLHVSFGAFGGRWSALSASVAAFAAYGFMFQCVPPVLSQLQAFFGVGDAEAGLLMSLVVVPGFLLALPAGFLVGKFGFRLVGFASLVVVAVGGFLTAAASSFPSLLLARFVVGLGGCFLSVGTPSVVSAWFRREELGRAMGVYSTGMPVATTLAFFSAPFFAERYGWRMPFIVGAVASILTALVFLFIVRDDPSMGSTFSPRASFRTGLRDLETLKLGAVWMLFNMASMGFFTWAPKLFVLFKGLQPVYAGVLASGVMVVNFIFVPFYGWASDRLGKRRLLVAAGLVGMGVALAALGYALGFWLTVFVAFLGLAAGAVPPLVMALTSERMPAAQAGISFAVLTIWQNLGVMLAAPAVGFLLQFTASVAWAFIGISSFAFAAAAVALLLNAG